VEQTQTPQTWRELLSIYIDDPQMRQGIADALGVNPITLTRWIKQQTIPRPQNLRRLLTVLTPQDRLLFMSLVDKEVEGFSTLLQDDTISGEPLIIPLRSTSVFSIRVQPFPNDSASHRSAISSCLKLLSNSTPIVSVCRSSLPAVCLPPTITKSGRSARS
jgi:hypothetical protein